MKKNNKFILILLVILILIVIGIGYFFFSRKGKSENFDYGIPPVENIGTISWLIMPLLYNALGYNVQYPDGFENAFNVALLSTLDIYEDIPFANLNELINYIQQRLNMLNVQNFNQDSPYPVDGPFHISPPNQEAILYDGGPVETFLQNFAQILSANIPNSVIIINEQLPNA